MHPNLRENLRKELELTPDSQAHLHCLSIKSSQNRTRILGLSCLGSHGDLCASAVTRPCVTSCARQANCPDSAIGVIRESSVLSYCNLQKKKFHLNQSALIKVGELR